MTDTIVRAVRRSLLLSSLAACAACASSADPAGESTGATAQSLASVEQWRATIATSPSAEEGCFHASFPSLAWEKIDCVEASGRPIGHPSRAQETVGNGDDYAAEVSSGLISQSVGTFPTVTGVTSETDGQKNTYSIQLNSNFMSGTAACDGVSGCLSWLQYVYSSSERAAFMQYWLIGIGKCPKGGGWASDGEGDCYKNSAAVTVPTIAITQLSQLKMSGTAVKGGKDTLVFTNGSEAYTTSGVDTVADLATAWTASEFNIIGDGGGSQAVFNKGSSVTVKLALTNGTTNAPKCVANDGTTGETNNLTLGSCSASGGSSPAIQFTESR